MERNIENNPFDDWRKRKEYEKTRPNLTRMREFFEPLYFIRDTLSIPKEFPNVDIDTAKPLNNLRRELMPIAFVLETAKIAAYGFAIYETCQYFLE